MDKCNYDENDEYCCDDCPMVDTRSCPEYVNDYDGWSTDAAAKS